MNTIKVFVVDDSALMRKIISDMINEESDMQVINTCRDGIDLFEKLKSMKPDVITLDVEMPRMDGISVLHEMKKRGINIPVIVLGSISKSGVESTMECLLNAGAFDFVSKPSGSISLDIDKVKCELIEKIRISCKKNVSETDYSVKKAEARPEAEFRRHGTGNIKAVAIGASTGGPKALYIVITNFPEHLGVPVFVVQHMPAGFTKAFAERLDNNSKIKVLEASDNEIINKDTVYIAPGGYHMTVQNDGRIHLNTEPPLWGVRPSVDKLFFSASNVYGDSLVSAVLTGMGKDGSNGTAEIKKNGGITIAEDESTCTIYGMPKAAYETGFVDQMLPINKIANTIVNVINGHRR